MLSNLKNDGYSLGVEYYLPERVFFRNLYGYCRCNTDEFLDEVYSVMANEIEEYVSLVLKQLEDAEKNNGPSAGSNAHILPYSFCKFVDKESGPRSSEQEKQKSRASNYLLSRCYNKICSVAGQLEQSNTNLMYKARSIQEDKETIKRFRKISESADPLSTRDFIRIQKITGVPLTKRTPEIKSYSDNQDIVVRFAIEKVIPSLILRSQRPMLSFLASREWRDVVCGYTAGRGSQSCVILLNSDENREFSEYMNSCFEELQNIANLSQEKQKVSQLGSVLVKIYDKIYTEHRKGAIWGVQCDRIPECKKVDSQRNSALLNADNKQYEHDWIISTHILNWLEWHHFEHQDIPEFLKSVGRVIDKIRSYVVEQIGASFTIDEFRKCKREEEPCDSLFAWSNCGDLLKLLLSTIHIEPIIFLKQHKEGGRYE